MAIVPTCLRDSSAMARILRGYVPSLTSWLFSSYLFLTSFSFFGGYQPRYRCSRISELGIELDDIAAVETRKRRSSMYPNVLLQMTFIAIVLIWQCRFRKRSPRLSTQWPSFAFFFLFSFFFFSHSFPGILSSHPKSGRTVQGREGCLCIDRVLGSNRSVCALRAGGTGSPAWSISTSGSLLLGGKHSRD